MTLDEEIADLRLDESTLSELEKERLAKMRQRFGMKEVMEQVKGMESISLEEVSFVVVVVVVFLLLKGI